MSEKKILSLLPAAFSLLMAIGTATVFRACPMKEDGTWMHCHKAQNAVVAAGAAMFVLLLIAAFVKNRMVRIALYGICVDTMRCYAVMQPFVRIMSGGVLVCSAIRIASKS